ncbi:MAG: PQQ-binding-like beta-propeller repeat protein, partial [Acidobacteria bacterium]|nr:PQQ-binding-like beta-propeller repeat protein [Acidobacteriota bacterium]MDW7984850.1 PQQ-binding-like beta-propeller repeat protein [Acidobacteriota bacterium]
GRWAWLWDLERGRLRWRLDLGASVTVRPVQTAQDVLVVATRGLLLYALDVRNGNRLWVLPLRAPVTRLILVEDARHQIQAPLVRAGASRSAWVALTFMDAPPMIVDVTTGRTLWQATDWTAWDAALGTDSTVAWASADRKVRVFRIRPQPTVRVVPGRTSASRPAS